MLPGRPWQPAHHEAATHKGATLLLLREAIDAAIPASTKGNLTRRCVLRCLAERSITQLGPGQFRVDAVPLNALENAVRAQTAADPALRSDFACYGKTTAVFNQLGGLVSQHTLVGGSQVVLLQARRLLKHLQPAVAPVCSSLSPGEPTASSGMAAQESSGGRRSSASGSYSGSDSDSNSGSYDSSSEDGGSEQLVMHPRAAATDSEGEEEEEEQQVEVEEEQPEVKRHEDCEVGLTTPMPPPGLPTAAEEASGEAHSGVLVYQLLPEELPFKLTSCSPGSLRYALRRSFAIMLGAPPTKVPTPPAAAALAHTALTAVLLASSIVRLKAAGHAVVLRLSDCSVHDAHSVLLKALLRSHNPQGNLEEFQQLYGGNLAALLSEQPLCSHLVQLGQRPAPAGLAASEWHSQRALLRVDRVWPEAWVPREDLLPTLGQVPLLTPQAAQGADPTEQHGSGEASAQQQQQQQQALPPPLQRPQRKKAVRLGQQQRRAQWHQKQQQGPEQKSGPPTALAPVNGHVTLLKRPQQQVLPNEQGVQQAGVQGPTLQASAGEQQLPLPPVEQVADLAAQQSEVSTPVGLSQQEEAQESQEQPPAHEQVEAAGGLQLAGQRTPEQEEQQGREEEQQGHQGPEQHPEVHQSQQQAQQQAQHAQHDDQHQAPHQEQPPPVASSRGPSPLELLELRGVFRQPAPASPQPQVLAGAGPSVVGSPTCQPPAPSLPLANGLSLSPAEHPVQAQQQGQQEQQQAEQHKVPKQQQQNRKQDASLDKLSASEAAQDGQPEGSVLGRPVRLLRLLLAAGCNAWALAAGINAQLVGGFMAAHCSRGEREQAQQATVLEMLLEGWHWAEAKAFMETSISVAGAVTTAHQGSNK